ncbi:S-adenosyl-L-methionine-dependent methyltransferase [Kockovaella imperatae]|uniref:S-adenosyl-L-methionine-dependent methyltransferase n=1 Tax=Kockovaella imperatae TaxID=4999 RepID=A0A1Y1UAW1_9TREE|nr:S-adenosyl-L-methionine-dependent methyltransferase [Kockovaella imperatae]ORX35181.1 S-adenosyl-L-methionine-dependent methyltransferase [Kockovaella imperatae]
MSWEEKWANGRTHWDQGLAHPSLVALLKSDEGRKLVPTQGVAVIPACGRGYDVHLLATHGLRAIGVEISPTGAEAARKWLREQADGLGQYDIVDADFFKWAEDSSSPKANVLLDYTFLCALDPHDRPKWKTAMSAAASPATEATLITIMFPLNSNRGPTEGPPFALSLDLYHELLDDRWELVYLTDIDKGSGMGRHVGPAGDEKLGIWKYRA